MTETTQRPLLERTLAANAWFSRVSGVVLAVASPWIADFAGLDTRIVLAVGLGLIGYSLWLDVAARQKPIKRIDAITAIVGDEAWVIGAIAVIFVLPDVLTTGGKWALTLVSLVVAAFSVAQVIGLQQFESPNR